MVPETKPIPSVGRSTRPRRRGGQMEREGRTASHQRQGQTATKGKDRQLPLPLSFIKTPNPVQIHEGAEGHSSPSSGTRSSGESSTPPAPRDPRTPAQGWSSRGSSTPPRAARKAQALEALGGGRSRGAGPATRKGKGTRRRWLGPWEPQCWGEPQAPLATGAPQGEHPPCHRARGAGGGPGWRGRGA